MLPPSLMGLLDQNLEFLNTLLTTPTESLLIPTEEIRFGKKFPPTSVLRKITDSVKNNKTYCFSTKNGPFGWCATCKVRNLSIVAISKIWS